MTSSTSAVDGRAVHTPELGKTGFAALRPSIAQVLLPYWLSQDKGKAALLLAVILTITFTSTYGFVALNDIQGELTDALIALDWGALKPLMVMSLLVGGLTVLLPIASTYVTGHLALRWRTWMTDIYIQRWTSGTLYFDMERDELISNADQRIAEDVRLVTEQSLTLLTSVAGVVVNTVAYTVLLWNIAGTLNFTVFDREFNINGYMVYAAYAYCFFHLWLSHWLGKSLIGLNMHKQTVEADLRHQGMQLREYSEQIAFYRGGQHERHHLQTRFEKVSQNTKDLLTRTFVVMFGQSFYGHIFTLLPTLLALPLLLSGEITYGDMVKITGAYAMLSGTIAFFPTAYISFTAWLGVTNRLRDLEWAMIKSHARIPKLVNQKHDADTLTCEQLSLCTPSGRPLAKIESWHVSPGERWIIRGKSGSGKSTLLRACAGLWPYGTGVITSPSDGRSMFLPQKSYIPTGTLKDALSYPNSSKEFSDESCRSALGRCCLPGLADALTVNDRWQHTLSGGEQQRFAMARVLLHKPGFVFLDEATSALDPETEQAIYTALLEELPDCTLISVAHRESLDRFHNKTLLIKTEDA